MKTIKELVPEKLYKLTKTKNSAIALYKTEDPNDQTEILNISIGDTFFCLSSSKKISIYSENNNFETKILFKNVSGWISVREYQMELFLFEEVY